MATKHYEPAQDTPRENPADVALRVAQGGQPEPVDVVKADHEALRQAEAEGAVVDTGADGEADRQPQQRAEGEAPNPAEEDNGLERVDERTRRRNEIYERKSAERAAENAKMLAEQPAEEPVAPVKEPVVEETPAKRTLKVDRQVREVDEGEFARLAQIGAATEGQFQEQKQLTAALREALARANNPPQDASRESPPTRDDPSTPAKKAPTRADRNQLTDEQLGELQEKLLYGEKTEGVEALRELIQSVAGQGQDVPSPDELLDHLEARLQGRAAMDQAGKVFAGKHSEIATDPTGAMQFATVRRLHADVVAELRNAGLDPEQLAQAERDGDAAFHFHKDLRTRQGLPLTDPVELTDRAAEWVKTEQRKRFGIPDPAPIVRASDPPAGRQAPPQPSREARLEQKEQMPLIRRAALSTTQQQRRSPGQPAVKTPVGAVVDEYKERRMGPRSV